MEWGVSDELKIGDVLTSMKVGNSFWDNLQDVKNSPIYYEANASFNKIDFITSNTEFFTIGIVLFILILYNRILKVYP